MQILINNIIIIISIIAPGTGSKVRVKRKNLSYLFDLNQLDMFTGVTRET